ncbi:unnamed protein product [Meloidogyne enterolobii]|uniref:Uncharacterized protein n=1 Tax=Meloidogyne enterolobii TaxID=390850 RepID=A0ACB1APC5_MELEN
MGKEELQKFIDNWLEWDKNDDTRNQISKLLEAGNTAELKALMIGELSFGTGGTRIGPGFTQLNELNVILLSHGMAQLLLQEMPIKKNKKLKIVVGFDGRHNSLRFAQLASNVFINNGICVTLFSECVPTPVVSFAVVELNCDAGLMITVSQNPTKYNGYTIYWNNGAQILQSLERKIRLLSKEQPKDEYWNTTTLSTNNLFSVADFVLEKYFCDESSACCFHKELNAKTSLKFIYSSFNGVAFKFAQRMFKEFGFPDDALSCVKEQAEPDPDVPTASSLDVLKLCYQTAEETGATFILANDADANRLQIAERQPDGDWYLFNGNEMGTLLTWWIWTQWKQQNPNLPGEDFYVINGAFSSHIVAKMAKIEGFKNDVSLTGFKYFGNRAHELRTKGKLVILAWEESIGFATGTTLDKSETSAVAVFAEMANYLASQKLNMKKQLLNICNKYGLYLNTNIIYSNPVRTGTRINVGGNIYSFLFKFSTKFTWYCTLHSNPQIKCTGSIHTYKKNNNNIIIIGTEHNNACISKKNSTQFTLNNTFPPQQQDLSSNISENDVYDLEKEETTHEEIPKSPISTNKFENVVVWGRGLLPVGTSANEELCVYVDNCEDEVVVGVKKDEILVPVSRQDFEQRPSAAAQPFTAIHPRQSFVFTPRTSGKYEVSVKSTASNAHLGSSPYKIVVGPKNISSIRAVGPGLEGGVAEERAVFYVDTHGRANYLEFSIDGPGKTEIIWCDNGDGTAMVEYTPHVQGRYKINIIEHDTNSHIKDSPFVLWIEPANLLPFKNIARPIRIPSFETNEGQVDNQFNFKIPKEIDAETFYVEIYDPNLQKVDFDCENKLEGNFYSFIPQKEGKVFFLIFYLV